MQPLFGLQPCDHASIEGLVSEDRNQYQERTAATNPTGYQYNRGPASVSRGVHLAPQGFGTKLREEDSPAELVGSIYPVDGLKRRIFFTELRFGFQLGLPRACICSP